MWENLVLLCWKRADDRQMHTGYGFVRQSKFITSIPLKKWLDRNPIHETYLKQQWGNGQARPMEGEGAFVVALPLLSGVKIMIGNSSILLALSIHGPFIAMSSARHVSNKSWVNANWEYWSNGIYRASTKYSIFHKESNSLKYPSK